MFALLKCWWHGHVIVASIDFHPTCAKYIYTCSRCKRVLPGPRTGADHA